MVELISGEPQKLLGIDKTGCYGAVLLTDTLAIKLVFLNFVVVRQRFVPPPPVMQAGPMHEIMQVDQTLLVPTAAPASASDAASCEPSLSAPVPTAPTMAAAVAPPPPPQEDHDTRSVGHHADRGRHQWRGRRLLGGVTMALRARAAMRDSEHTTSGFWQRFLGY